jgi:hypothetical protein
LAARLPILGSDLCTHQPQQFRQKDSPNEDSENDGVERGKPIQGKSPNAEGPEGP